MAMLSGSRYTFTIVGRDNETYTGNASLVTMEQRGGEFGESMTNVITMQADTLRAEYPKFLRGEYVTLAKPKNSQGTPWYNYGRIGVVTEPGLERTDVRWIGAACPSQYANENLVNIDEFEYEGEEEKSE